VRNELKHAREKVRLSKGSEQPGFMGLGAYEADVYRDAIKRQVQTILKKLERVGKKGFCSGKGEQSLAFSLFRSLDTLTLEKVPSSTL